MLPDPLVTVVIPTVIAGPLLSTCLQALNRQTFREFEVFVINNGTNQIHSWQPPMFFPCRVLVPGSNVGFGAAINLAIRATSTPFIATLNDDTRPDPEWLQALVREVQTDTTIGMCASRIRLSETGQLDSAGMLICLDGSSKQRGQSAPFSSFPLTEEVLFPSACAALYRRELFNEIGLFDEDYFLYCEDTDLGVRARWAGWRCRYVAGACVTHDYSRTAGPFSKLKAYYVERNRIWVALKTFPALLLPLVPVVSCARYFWQFQSVRKKEGAAAEFVSAGNSMASVVALLARAYWETLRRLPALLRKRATVRRTRRLGSLVFTKLLFHHRISARALARL